MTLRSGKKKSRRSAELLRFAILVFLSVYLSVSPFKNAAAQTPEKLTPETAGAAIRQSPHFSDIHKKIPLHEAGYLKGLEQGMWTGGISGPDELLDNSSADPVRITERGHEFFQSIEIHPGGTDFLVLNRSVEPEIQVLSIKPAEEGSGRTEVTFSWRYTDLPSVAKRFAAAGGTGTVRLRPTPEGWMTDGINVQYDRSPISLTREEKAEERKDLARHKALEEERKKKKAEEKKRMKALMREAKTPTRQIAEFDFDFSRLDTSTQLKRSYRFTATLSDVDIRVDGTEAVGTELFDYSYSLWFDHVSEITRGVDEELGHHWIKIKSRYGKIAYWASPDRSAMDKVHAALISAKKNWEEKFGQASARFPR